MSEPNETPIAAEDEMIPPSDADAMRPHIFGEESKA